MYFIVNKNTYSNGVLQSTPIGYVEDKTEFESIHGFAFIEWAEANQTTDKTVWFD